MMSSSIELLHAIQLEGLSIIGSTNVTDEVYLANIQHALRLQHQQVKPQPINGERVCLVGGGPSLNDTLPELVDLIRQGAKLVTVNGAYQWALEHNLHPVTQVVIDARAFNARFVNPPVPRCNYLVGSIASPELWAALDGRERVWMFHPVTREGDSKVFVDTLDAYYLGPNWVSVGGGTTVTTRALSVLRTLGYLRYDLFGIDCCWMGDQHHAYPQPENDRDNRYRLTVCQGTPQERVFECAGWHVKQLDDFLQMIKLNGQHFLLNVHGDGLLAYALRTAADAADIAIEAAA